MTIKEKLRQCQKSIGTWISIGHPSVIEILASAGFEWFVLDMEHSAISLETAQVLMTAAKSKNTPVLVRVPENHPTIIKRVLDLGADGIIVPMVNTKAEATQAVESAYYPNAGRRGVGLYRAQNYGIGFPEYREKLENKELIVIAQIEHIDAVNNLEGILDVDGIDGTIIGPYDLSASMGHPGDYERDDVKAAIQRVESTCKKRGKSLGFHVIPSKAEELQKKLDEGYNFVAFSLDFFFLGDRAREEMEKIQ